MAYYFQSQKNEVMLISNDFNDNNFELLMDDTILNIVETHKHLQVGVHLSSNNKWSKHIDSIIESASKQISYLRKIKYQFSKQTPKYSLLHLYTTTA